MITLLKLSRGRKIMLAFVLMPGVVVIGISCARLYLCVVGQWASDGSWYYDPQLTIEVAEVGGTLMALSVPGLKPMFGIWYDKLRTSANSTFRRTNENPDPERLGYERKMSDSRRRSHWMHMQNGFLDGNVKTSVNADSSTARASSKGSNEDLVSARDIMVQTEVNQRSIPLRTMGPDNHGLEKVMT